jgi:hypothetical protein
MATSYTPKRMYVELLISVKAYIIDSWPGPLPIPI